MRNIMEDFFCFYEVGGRIRDELLGLQSKDVDYVAVPNDSLLKQNLNVEQMFEVLVSYLKNEKFEIFLITNDCFTIRAKFPTGHKHKGVADFVMARKECGYIPGTRKPINKPGSLYDDLSRRDATVNAMAKGDDDEIIDYFNGIEDLKNRILRTPLDPIITFNDDPLRILRFARFSITKDLVICDEADKCILDYDYDNLMYVVSEERIREELYKCFKHDTLKTIELLNKYHRLRDYIFKKTTLWLKPTNEQ